MVFKPLGCPTKTPATKMQEIKGDTYSTVISFSPNGLQ